MTTPDFPRMDRRTAIKWMLSAYAGLALAPHAAFGQRTSVAAKGYGTDPEMVKSYNPGELWPLTLTAPQRRLVTVLCDVIIPADEHSPSASAVGVPDFIDEWISAPYDANVQDRRRVLEGLEWMDAESQKRFGHTFVEANDAQRAALCDDLCYDEAAREELKPAAGFFARFRDLTAGGFYTTPEGMKDVGYIGNVPLASFDGPPADLIKRLGLG